MNQDKITEKGSEDFKFSHRRFLVQILIEFPSPAVMAFIKPAPLRITNLRPLDELISSFDKKIRASIFPFCLASFILISKVSEEKLDYQQITSCFIIICNVMRILFQMFICKKKLLTTFLYFCFCYAIIIAISFFENCFSLEEKFADSKFMILLEFFVIAIVLTTVVVNCLYILFVFVVLLMIFLSQIVQNFRLLSQIPRKPYQKIKEKEVNCVFCLNEIEEGIDVTELKCSHPFHFSCGVFWLRKKPYCPICKERVILKK